MHRNPSNHEAAKISFILLSAIDNSTQSMASALEIWVPRKKVNMDWNHLIPLSLLELLQFNLHKAHCYFILIGSKS